MVSMGHGLLPASPVTISLEVSADRARRAAMATLMTPAGGTGSTVEPSPPTIYVPPTKVAADTYVIHQVQEALGEPLFVYLNSLVILGEQPVIVDTGTPANRSRWMEDVFSIVEPGDVEWVFL